MGIEFSRPALGKLAVSFSVAFLSYQVVRDEVDRSSHLALGRARQMRALGLGFLSLSPGWLLRLCQEGPVLLSSCKAVHAANHVSGAGHKYDSNSEKRFLSAEVIMKEIDYSIGEVMMFKI